MESTAARIARIAELEALAEQQRTPQQRKAYEATVRAAPRKSLASRVAGSLAAGLRRITNWRGTGEKKPLLKDQERPT